MARLPTPVWLTACTAVAGMLLCGCATPVQRQPLSRGLIPTNEYEDLENQLKDHGVRTYEYRRLGENQNPPGEEVRGLVLIRDAQNLRPLGNDFYDDGRGNLVYFGQISTQQAPSARVSLTQSFDGKTLLAVDVDNDRIVDLAASRGLDRFGSLGLEKMRPIRDCLESAVREGRDAVAATLDCMTGGGRGGTAGRPFEDFLDQMLEPDCGPDFGLGFPWEWIIQSDLDDEELKEVERFFRDHYVERERIHIEKAKKARLSGDEQLGRAHDRVGDAAGAYAGAIQEILDTEPDTNARYQAELAATAAAARYFIELNRLRAILESRRDRRERGPGGAGPSGYPDPLEPPRANDPRCGPQAEWNWLLSGQCREDAIDCLRRMNDPVYAATDGQCWTQTDEADERVIRCRENETMRSCIEGGGSIPECTEQTIKTCTGEGPEGRRPEGCAGFGPLPPSRGPVSNIELLQVSPLGGAIAAICQEGGGAGFCHDPPPISR